MSFLSDSQTGEIENMLTDGGAVPDSPLVADTPSEAPADVNVEAPEIEQQEQETSASLPESDPATAAVKAEESGHRVPYNRFKDVNDRKNEYRNQAKSLKRELKEARAQLEQFQSKPSVPAEESLDDWLGGVEDTSDPYDERFNELNGRLYEFEVQQASVSLSQEVSKARDKYPGVPEQVLYKAVVDDGEVDVMEIAERYNDFIDTIQQQAIERYMQESKPEPKKAAPRPRKSGSSPSNPTRPSKTAAPKTLSDASAALRKHLKENPLF